MNKSDPRRQGLRKTSAGLVCAVLASILAGMNAQAWTPLDQTETWTAPGTAGWSNTVAGVTLTNSAGYLNFAFPSQFTPAFVGGLAKRAVDPGTLLTNIAFRIAASNTPPSQLTLCLHSRLTGNTWYCPLPAPAAGAEIDCEVPVEYTKGWRMGPLSTPEAFSIDVKTVDWIGLYVRRNGDTTAQSYALDDFRVRGQYWPEDRDLDGMENDWETRYGFLPDDPRDSTDDPDHDGMSNYAEARAGTDPTNGASVFQVHIQVQRDSGDSPPRVMVWWNSISNRSYTVRRTDGAGKAFGKVMAGMASTPGTNVFEDVAATNAASAFYRVDVDP